MKKLLSVLFTLAVLAGLVFAAGRVAHAADPAYTFKGAVYELSGFEEGTSSDVAGYWGPWGEHAPDWDKFYVYISPDADAKILASTLVEAYVSYIFTDQDCTVPLTSEPQAGTTYYIKAAIFNKNGKEDHSVDFTQVDTSKCSVTVKGYDSAFVKAVPGPVFERDGIDLIFSITRKTAVPYTVDLSKGRYAISVMNEFYDLMDALWEKHTYYETTDTRIDWRFDLDGDGTDDVGAFADSKEEAFYLEYYADSNITEVSFFYFGTSTVYDPITFKFPVKYPVWVSDTDGHYLQVTSANADDVLGDGKIKYDPETFTMTLTEAQTASLGIRSETEKFTVTGTGTNLIPSVSHYGNGKLTISCNITGDYIYAAGDLSVGAVTLELVNAPASPGSEDYDAICCRGTVLFEGSTVTAKAPIRGYAIWAGQELIISGSKVTAENESCTVTPYGAVASGGRIEITDSQLTAESKTTTGIYSSENVIISGSSSSVTAKGLKGNYGICAEGNIQVQEGRLEGESKGYGIYASGGIIIATTHMITVPEGGVFSGEKKTIYNSDSTGAAPLAVIAHKEGLHTVTVNGGFAYLDDDPNNKITTATKGQTVYVGIDPVLPGDKQYLAGITSNQIGTLRFLELPDRTLSFTMPDEDVLINLLFEDQVPLTVDLTDGSETLSAPYYRELTADLAMAEYFEVIEINGIDVNHSGTFVSVFDLDKDGNYDIIRDIENGFSLYADCNLTGEYTIPEITGSTMTFNPITFIFPGGEDAVYTATVSGATSFTEGEAEEMVITVKRDPNDTLCFSFFAGVQIDGKELVKDTDYTAVSGSTVITLKADTLNKLTAGEHTVTALFEDGQTETQLTVSAATTTAPEETTTAADETTTATDGTTTAASDETTTAADETTTAADETTTAADETTTAADETTKASDEETKPSATVPEETKPDETKPSEEAYPETGDAGGLTAWIMICLTAAVVLAAVTVFGKKILQRQ